MAVPARFVTASEGRTFRVISRIFNTMIVPDVLAEVVCTLEAITASVVAAMRTRVTVYLGLVGQLMSEKVRHSCALGTAFRVSAKVGRVHGSTSMVIKESLTTEHKSTLGTTVFHAAMHLVEVKPPISAQALITFWDSTAE